MMRVESNENSSIGIGAGKCVTTIVFVLKNQRKSTSFWIVFRLSLKLLSLDFVTNSLVYDKKWPKFRVETIKSRSYSRTFGCSTKDITLDRRKISTIFSFRNLNLKGVFNQVEVLEISLGKS